MSDVSEMEVGRFVVAVAQMDPKIRDRAANVATIERMTQEAASKRARLILFPECALTGYGYVSRVEAFEDAEPIPGPTTDRLARMAAELDIHIVFGMVERNGEDVYNAAPFIGPGGLIGVYRKTHLPFEVLDRFAKPGDVGLPVFDTSIGRVGILICYDMRFPEPARVLALKGADIILHPTNLPPPGAPQPDFMYQSRAAENRVWVLSADRVGLERGVRFIGRSMIVDPTGARLAEGSADGEELLFAEIEPAIARQKDLIIDPGVYELHPFRDRRPELYAEVTRGTLPVGGLGGS